MIALDTNVLLRLVVKDDTDAYRKIKNMVQKLDQNNAAFISVIVIVEFVWVLTSTYKTNKNDIVGILNDLIIIEGFVVENASCVRDAIDNYKKGNADFSDYLIHAIAAKNGCDTVKTFDKKALKSKGFSKP